METAVISTEGAIPKDMYLPGTMPNDPKYLSRQSSYLAKIREIATNESKAFAQTLSHQAPHERLEDMVAALKSSIAEVRGPALNKISEFQGTDRTVLEGVIADEVEQKLGSENPAMRSAAMRMLRYTSIHRTDFIKRGLCDPDKSVQNSAAGMMSYLLTEDMPEVIRIGFSSKNLDVISSCAALVDICFEDEQEELQNELYDLIHDAISRPKEESVEYISLIHNLPPEIRLSLIRQGVEGSNFDVQLACYWSLKGLPEDLQEDELRQKVSSNISSALASEDIAIRRKAARFLYLFPEDNREEKIQEMLHDEDEEVRYETIFSINSFTSREKALCIQIGLQDRSAAIRLIAAGAITLLKNEEKAAYITQGLTQNDIATQLRCAECIPDLTDLEQSNLREKVDILVAKYITSENEDIRKSAVELIFATSTKNQMEFIEIGLKDTNELVQRTALRAFAHLASVALHPSDSDDPYIHDQTQEYDPDLPQVSLDAQTYEVYKNLILVALATGVESAITDLHSIIDILFESDKITIIREGLRNVNSRIQKESFSLIQQVSQQNQAALTSEALQQGVGKILIQNPLYENVPLEFSQFSRVNFEKTGSQTTLLGGQLQDEVIERKGIPPNSFLIWLGVYENHKLWEDLGYVPIEPIVRYRLSEDNQKVAVATKVLDISLGDWQKITKYNAEFAEMNDYLEQTRKSILETLENQGIVHGHDHEHNFCLYFEKDANGQPDFTKKPRLYLIDWDSASRDTYYSLQNF